MANKASQEEFVKTWRKRIERGKKAKEKWEDDYEVSTCKEFWKGNQLDEPYDEFGQRRVQINKIHPTVRSSIPTLYFNQPFVRVRASPALADTPGQTPGISMDDKVQLLQDLGNTFVRAREVNFDEATHLAMKEAHWAFGCVRVMHDAVPVENPSIPAPPLKEKKDTPIGAGEVEDPEADKGTPEKRLGDILGLSDMPWTGVSHERFYVKRIPARQVIFSSDESGVIEENPWIGYWTVALLEDVKRTKIYKNTQDLKASGIKTGEDGSDEKDKGAANKVKLYHIWDLRIKMHYVFAEDHDLPLLQRKFKRFPLKLLRLDVDPDALLPIPPIYQMLHPQYEQNDSREWLRMNRKGTVPRYTYDEDAVDPANMKKLESGEMGTYIPRKQNTHDVIEPVNQPNYSAVAAQTLALSDKEFAELSMVGGERRGVPQSKTATQAKIVDVRSQVQESFDRTTVSKWLASIVEELILLAIDEMSLPQWVLLNADPTAAGYPMEAQKIEAMWQQITHVDLIEAADGIAWEVVIDPDSMSPVANEEEKQAWLQALSLLGNETMTRLLHFSPEIRKRTLNLYGIRSARDQELIGQAFEMMVQFQVQMAQMGASPSPGMASQPGAPPGMGSPAAARTPVQVAAPSPGPPQKVGA